MRKYLVKLFAIVVVFMLVSNTSFEQVVVRIRPAAPFFRPRPARPGRVHVWVGDEYNLRRGEYIYQEGYWAVPPPGMHIWKPGRWRHYKGGWVWIPGFWR